MNIYFLLIDWVNLWSQSLKISLKGSYDLSICRLTYSLKLRVSLQKYFRYVLKFVKRMLG